MTEIDLPGLRNNEPLGFLAALGLISIFELCIGADVRLGWSGVGGEARLELEDGWDLDRVVEALEGVVATLDDFNLVDARVQGFPIPKVGTSGSDPMRMPFAEARGLALHAANLERGGEAVMARWLSGTVNLCARRKPDKSDQALNPLYAPAGQQTFASNFSIALSAVKRCPQHLRHALVGWRRVPGFAGANLDHRAERDSAATPDAEVKNLGVPGATWLALMSVPQMRLTGDGTYQRATLFQRPARGRETMVWPLWRRPLAVAAVRALIEHPATRLSRDKDGTLGLDSRSKRGLAALDVDALAWAQRRHLGKSAGPIGPATLIVVA